MVVKHVMQQFIFTMLAMMTVFINKIAFKLNFISK